MAMMSYNIHKYDSIKIIKETTNVDFSFRYK
jgi:hypothetical protein